MSRRRGALEVAGFTFVGRQAQIAAFREALARPGGELVVLAGHAGTGKSHLLRRLRREAEGAGDHFVQLNELDYLPDPELRAYSILSAVAASHRTGEHDEGFRPLLENAATLVESVMTEERRSPAEKLLRVLAAAAANLSANARFVLLLDLGPLEADEAFPLGDLACRLPDGVKVVAAARSAPGLPAASDRVSVLDALPPLSEDDVRRVVGFHVSEKSVAADLAALIFTRHGGNPMATDMAAKIAASADDPLEAVEALPTDLPGICDQLLTALDVAQQELALCFARVPSGSDLATLRALTDFSDGELRQLLRSDGIRNVLVAQRMAGRRRARLFHEIFAGQVLESVVGDTPETQDFHARASALFLQAFQRDTTHVDALSAHAHHLGLSGDKRQFISDFAKTYRAKHSLRLLRQLAKEYAQLLECIDELGEGSINRQVCLANLGRVCLELGRHDDALRCFRQALELCRQHDDAAKAEQLANLASVHKALGQLDEAIERLRQAAQLDEQAGNPPGLAADWNSLGIIYQERAQLDEAFACHEKALELHEQLDNPIGVANQLVNMAAIHRELGRLADARDCYQRAWRIDATNNAMGPQIADLCNLGLIFQDLGETDKAVSCFEQAISLDHATADREAEARHRRALALVHRQAQQHNDAIAALQQALEIHRAIGSPTGEAADLDALAATYQAAGDLALARDLFGQAAGLHAVTGERDAEAAARAAIEKIDRQLRGEGLAGDDAAPPEAPQPAETIVREPSGEGPWSHLELVDEAAAPQNGLVEPFAPEAPDHELTTEDHGDEASVLLELASEVHPVCEQDQGDAKRRITELEAQVQACKEAIEDLRRERDKARRRVGRLTAKLQVRQQAAHDRPEAAGEDGGAG